MLWPREIASASALLKGIANRQIFGRLTVLRIFCQQYVTARFKHRGDDQSIVDAAAILTAMRSSASSIPTAAAAGLFESKSLGVAFELSFEIDQLRGLLAPTKRWDEGWAIP